MSYCIKRIFLVSFKIPSCLLTCNYINLSLTTIKTIKGSIISISILRSLPVTKRVNILATSIGISLYNKVTLLGIKNVLEALLSKFRNQQRKGAILDNDTVIFPLLLYH